MYSEWIWSAFGEPPDFGVMKFANALGASTSEIRTEDASAAIRSRDVRRRRLASEASGRKAARFYLGGPRLDPRRGGGPGLAGALRAQPGRGPAGHSIYSPPLRVRRGIRATAWVLVATGIALPALRRRARIPPGRGARRRRARARGAVRRRPPLAGTRRRRLRAQHVGLPRRVRDAARRPRAARGAGARRLSGRDRPGPRSRGAADAPSPARVLDAGHGEPVRAGARLVPLDVVLRAPRDRRLRVVAGSGAVPERGGADVRRVRRRRRVLLGDPDRAAVVRGVARAPRGRRGAAGTADDDRVRRAVLGGTLGRPLRCPRRKSACCHAVAAFRHVTHGRSPALRGRPGRGCRSAGPTRSRSAWRSCTSESTTRST